MGRRTDEPREDIKQIMAENKDRLFCAKCNAPLEEIKEPMVRIIHYFCPNCNENKVGKSY